MTDHDSGASDSALVDEASIPAEASISPVPEGGVTPGDGASSASSIDCSTIVACSLLTQADVTSAAGMDLGSGMESDTPISGGAHDWCFYGDMNGGSLVALNLECNPSGFSAATLQQMVPSTATPVTGVGDAAYWDGAGDAGADGPSDLYVEAGGILFIISYTPGTPPITVDIETAAEAMATAVAKRL